MPQIKNTGIGLRIEHFQQIQQQKPDVAWFEILTDNYLIEGTSQRDYLFHIRKDYPLTFHGVGLSLGSVDPLNLDYLQRLKQLKEEIQPAWISDHLCWTSAHGIVTHDLIPLPYHQTVVDHVVSRIQQVQDFLSMPLLIENVSSYLQFKADDMTEWDFIHAIVKKSGCYLLLDVNNIYVSAQNHQFDAETYLQAMPAEQIKEIHLAGYEDHQTHLLDTHSRPVSDPVWALFASALAQFGNIPSLIEWDNDIPDLKVVLNEAKKADHIRKQVLK